MTLHFSHPYSTWPYTILRPTREGSCIRESQLTTHNVSICHIPAIIADSSPLSSIVNFQTSESFTTINQANHWTTDPCHSVVGAVASSPPTVLAIVKEQLSTGTVYLVYPHMACLLTFINAADRVICSGETKLPAHYVSVSDIPGFVTDRAPLFIIKYLNCSRGECSIYKTYSTRTNG